MLTRESMFCYNGGATDNSVVELQNSNITGGQTAPDSMADFLYPMSSGGGYVQSASRKVIGSVPVIRVLNRWTPIFKNMRLWLLLNLLQEKTDMTKNNLISYQFRNNAMRTVVVDGEPWFIATDVCAALEIKNAADALKRLDDDERSRFNLGRQGEAYIVNEFGLYNLILGSRKKEAKEFKRWITHEVLPSIRKTGSYSKSCPVGSTLVKSHCRAVKKKELGKVYQAFNDALDLYHKDERKGGIKDYRLTRDEAQIIEKVRSHRAFFGLKLLMEVEKIPERKIA